MRILQVSPFFSPQMGGSPQIVYHTARELANRGHQVTVVAGNFGMDKITFPPEAYNTVIIPSLISKWGFYFTPNLIHWIQHHIHNFDIIHCHEARTFQNVVVRMAAVHAKVPFVISAHGTLPIIVQRQFFKRVYDLLFGRRNLAKAHYLLAISEAEAIQYQQFGIEPNRIRVIHNGLNLEEYKHLPPRGSFRDKLPKLSSHTKIILYLGRIHQRKGINYLIESLSYMKADTQEIFLAIVGPDDGELNKLQVLTQKLDLQDRVSFIGPLYGIDKLAALQDADVLVYPAIHEYFGLVPFEALLCGTPVIVIEDCGLGQLIRQAEAGYLVPYADANAIAGAIQNIFTHPEQAYLTVEAGQKFIRDRLDWNNIVMDLENLYQLCINQNGIKR